MGEVIRGGSTSLTSAEFGVLDDRPSPSMLVLVATLAAATVCQGAFAGAGRWLVGLGLVAAIGLDVTMSRSVAMRHGRLGAAATALAIWITVRDVADGSLDGGPARVAIVGRCRCGRRDRPALATTRPCDHRVGGSCDRCRGGCVGMGGSRLAHRAVGHARHVDLAGVVDPDLPERSRCDHGRCGAPRDQCAHVRPRSVAHAIATSVLMIGAVATQSRAGAVAATCGVAVLVLIAGPRRVIGATAGPAIGAAVACAGLAPGLSVDRSERPASAIVGLLVGLGIVAASTRVPGVVQRRLATVRPPWCRGRVRARGGSVRSLPVVVVGSAESQLVRSPRHERCGVRRPPAASIRFFSFVQMAVWPTCP